MSEPLTNFRLVFPSDGALVNPGEGRMEEGSLRIEVRGEAPDGARVRVNGQCAERSGTGFSASVALAAPLSEIVAEMETPAGLQRARACVQWEPDSPPRYRIAIDDNIWFLRHTVKTGSRSLFDCFYLAGLRRLHEEFGASFVLNLFFTDGEGFDLSMVPDTYRVEWMESSNWLKLAFHSYAESPSRPYQNAEASQILRDMKQVESEVLRFAGPDTLTPATVIHYAITPRHVLSELARHGVRCLSGLFRQNATGWGGNYGLGAEQSQFAASHEAIIDFESGIVFSLIDMIVNNTPLEQVEPILDRLESNPAQSRIMDILTHEQYFWPSYKAHIPDHFARLETALRWLTGHGYKSVFLHEGLLGTGKHPCAPAVAGR